MKTVLRLLVVLLLAILAFGGGYWYASRRPQLAPRPTGVTTKPSVVVYVPRFVDTRTEWEAKPVPVGEGEDPLRVALEHLLITRDTPFPQGTRLLGVNVTEGVAEVNFSRELIDNFPGGSTTEAWIVESLRKTLAQFSDVERARILVEGKPIDTIGEHIDLSQPVAVR
ncbi:MAG: GerMN domain-containing protein [bacterium]|nr:GerMN domain-containing protein [bacterium]MCS7310200.1 GerMN domain-containing protein [Armatimonadota bacterium]MDW8105774.1 GerMN domain-containing protein [Armatimonadota bacterium]